MNDISGAKFATTNDGQLLARFAKIGDQSAFSELIRRHGPMVLRICRRVAGGDASLAEDASQQVFLALAGNADALSTRTTIAGWLYRTAWHVITRLRRQRSVHAKHEMQAAEFQAASARTAFHETIPFAVATSELSEALGKALATLPESYRDAIVLHHFAGHTVEETARILEAKTGTVASWLSRGRSALRTRLDGFGALVSVDALVLWMNSHADEPVLSNTIHAENDMRQLSPFKEASSWNAASPSAVTPISSASGMSAFSSARWVAAAVIGLGVSGTAMAAAGGPVAAVASISYIFHRPPAGPDRPYPKTEAVVEPANDGFKPLATTTNARNSNFGSGGTMVPEPTTGAILMGLGSVLLVSRRRHQAK